MQKLTHEIVSGAAADLLAQAATDPAVQTSIDDAFEARWRGVESFGTELRTAVYAGHSYGDAQEVFERVEAHERALASPGLTHAGYALGSARFDDHIVTLGDGPVAMSAEHATNPIRKDGNSDFGDPGTGGLAGVLAADGWVTAHVLTGRQTIGALTPPEEGKSPIANPDYPLRDVLRNHLITGDAAGYFGLHGCFAGQVTSPLDTKEIHGHIGLGLESSEQSRAAAEEIVRRAAEIGLRVVIANDTQFLVYRKDPSWQRPGPMRTRLNELVVGSDGRPRTSRLAALGLGSMVNFVNGTTGDAPLLPGRPSFQVEISNTLLYTPPDYLQRDPIAHAVGVQAGHAFAVMACDVAASTR